MTFIFFFTSPTTSIHMQQQPAQSSETITRGRTAGRAEARSERDRARRRSARMTPDQVASRRARDRERHANQTPEQRQARRVRRNTRSMVGSNNLDATDVISSMVGSNNLDAINVVYQNLSESTHMLKPKPDCHHCGAKRFEYE